MKNLHLAALILSSALSGCVDPNHSFVGAGNQAGMPTPGKGQAASTSKGGPNLAALSPGTPCRLDLIRPAGQGQAYEGTVVRVEDKAVVLSNVISEGPCKRSRPPSINDVLEMRVPFASGPTTIDWERLPDKEVRVAKSEIAAAKVLDHDPLADHYER